MMLLPASVGLGFAGGEWTPANLATPPAMWVDDESTVTDVSGFASAITNQGSLGTDGNYSQANNTRYPAINATGIGGLRTLDFDGLLTANGDFMQSQTNAHRDLFRNVSAGWLFAVYDKIGTDGAPQARNVLRYNAPDVNPRCGLLAGRGAVGGANLPAIVAKRLDASTSTVVGSLNGARTDVVMILGYFDWSGNVQYLHIDGALDNSGSIDSSGGSISDTRALSCVMGTVDAGNDSGNADVRLGCAMSGASTLTTDEIDRIFGWAAHKWGLTANLPALHPYKSAPPTV